jgi:hypothetical protein
MTLPLHPACRLFSPMSDDERDRVANDIRQRGLLHPIVRHEGATLAAFPRLEAEAVGRIRIGTVYAPRSAH